jgi:hypothetical protein
MPTSRSRRPLKKSSWANVIPVLTLEGAGLSFSCRTSMQWSARKLIYLALPENGSASEEHWEMKPDAPQKRFAHHDGDLYSRGDPEG